LSSTVNDGSAVGALVAPGRGDRSQAASAPAMMINMATTRPWAVML
jgi:hypothetical protein